VKHTVKEIRRYRNFNESERVQVRQITLNCHAVAGISFYKSAHNCSFLLSHATLSYVIKGEKYMLVNKQEYVLKAGDLLYIPANSVVFTDIPETDSGFESCNIILSQELLQASGILFHRSQLKNKTVFFEQHHEIINIYREFLKHLSAGCIEFLQTIFTKTQLLEDKTHSEKPDIIGLQHMNNALLEYIYQPVDLPQLAHKSNMSLATFKRRFKSAFGQSPKTWIRNVRLQAAYFHLKTGRQSVSDVSSFVGFENFAHFSYAFKKYFRTTPSTLLLH